MANNFSKFVLVLHLQFSLSIVVVLHTPKNFSKVSHDKLPAIYL